MVDLEKNVTSSSTRDLIRGILIFLVLLAIVAGIAVGLRS